MQVNTKTLFVVGLGITAAAIWYTQSGPTKAPDPLPTPVIDRGEVLLFVKSNCAPCAQMKVALQDPKVQTAMRGVKLVEKDWGSRSTRVLYRNWKINGTPTLVWVNPQGTELKRQEGAMTPAELVTFFGG
jgi:thioredoxin-related protein